ncbi:MAG: hypothetical protein CYG60_09165 [Actinobacteria bacterium]|nr:MAG: hypothetical protein CYG60_09165 [Actinomycetota bacterium]
MGYYMLFQHSPGAASDTPLGIHVRKADVNALCVFSSGEAAATARDAAAPDYYMEAVTPDDVVSLAAIHGVDVVALDAYQAKPTTLVRTVDVVEALTS